MSMSRSIAPNSDTVIDTARIALCVLFCLALVMAPSLPVG